MGTDLIESPLPTAAFSPTPRATRLLPIRLTSLVCLLPVLMVVVLAIWDMPVV